MIEELANLFDIFPGKANQMCCFLHILNLIAKSIIKQFDLLKAASDAFLDETTQELLELAGDLDLRRNSHMMKIKMMRKTTMKMVWLMSVS